MIKRIIMFTKLSRYKYCAAALSVFSTSQFDGRKSIGAVGGVEIVGSHVSVAVGGVEIVGSHVSVILLSGKRYYFLSIIE